MMKRLLPIFVILGYCASVFGSIADDGVISVGEYDYGIVEWTSGLLVVKGGGANTIEVRNSAHLEVQSTSTPINGDWDTGGIQYLDLYNNSNLNYYAGKTFELTLRNSATAHLSGGRIDYIASYQYATTEHVNIYCQSEWSWLLNGQAKVGITGLWNDGSTFNIRFMDKEYLGFDPVWENINVIPEPATVCLMGLGLLLLKKRYKS